jgi:spore coat polysaccharide biosynthesis protein SpsF
MSILAIVQARTTSERLPGKVLAELDGRPVLAHLLDRLNGVRSVDQVVLAVPTGDRALLDWAATTSTTVRQGDEHDVLGRFAAVVDEFRPDVVVRLTGDCPLLDPTLVDQGIDAFGRAPCDYQIFEGYPRGLADIEIVPSTRLRLAASLATDPWHREHVMPWIRNNADFDIRELPAPPALRRPGYRLCVDEPADLMALRAICARVPEPRSTVALIDALDADPALVEINESVLQRS